MPDLIGHPSQPKPWPPDQVEFSATLAFALSRLMEVTPKKRALQR
jgi:hypothetical protein